MEEKRSFLDRANEAWWGIGAILLSVSLAWWGGRRVKGAFEPTTITPKVEE